MNVLNFDSKHCDRVRRQLDAYLSNELLVETTNEVLKHLESCEACSQELESRVRVREALQRAAARHSPPEYLREAIHQRLRSAQPRLLGRFHATTWAVALASLALVLVAGQQWLRLRKSRQLVASVLTLGVTDHLHCAIQAHNYPEVANPPAQLRQKLGPQHAELLPVVEARLSGFQVLEAHICSVPGSPRKYVHFIARGQGTILSVILTKREGVSLPAGRFLAAGASDGIHLYEAKLEGASVAGFETNNYFGFVVSDLGQDEMTKLAAALAPGLRSALDGSTTEKSATSSFLAASVNSARHCLFDRNLRRENEKVNALKMGDKIAALVSSGGHAEYATAEARAAIRIPDGISFVAVRPEQIAECVPSLLSLIAEGKVKLFADDIFPLTEVKKAFEALASRRTIGKVALIP